MVLDKQILEKPADKKHAVQILSSLSGRQHIVHTAVCLLLPKEKGEKVYFPYSCVDGENKPFIHSFVETSEVTFAALEQQMIEKYVETGIPM